MTTVKLGSWEKIEQITGWRPRRTRPLTYGDLSLKTGMSPQELMQLSDESINWLVRKLT
jgi:hypothetical protein